MVTVSDAEKNALVIEIEENLLASMQQKPKFIQVTFNYYSSSTTS